MKRATAPRFYKGDTIAISIHALVKRATEPLHSDSESDMHFNPRPREEGDSFHCLYNTPFLYFNPRPREEGDVAHTGTVLDVGNFNPRPREEGDLVSKKLTTAVDKFQSTPS